ncbi:hypothetical protein [Streptomyces sp. NPDC058335]|uniref:hypothetical protein n=1 Tax=Streptomyces sp. NPDC058335 TaxID=3346451 RepID=UPI003660B1D7
MRQPWVPRRVTTGRRAGVDQHRRVLSGRGEQQVHRVSADHRSTFQVGDPAPGEALLEPVGEFLAETGHRGGRHHRPYRASAHVAVAEVRVRPPSALRLCALSGAVLNKSEPFREALQERAARKIGLLRSHRTEEVDEFASLITRQLSHQMGDTLQDLDRVIRIHLESAAGSSFLLASLLSPRPPCRILVRVLSFGQRFAG